MGSFTGSQQGRTLELNFIGIQLIFNVNINAADTHRVYQLLRRKSPLVASETNSCDDRLFTSGICVTRSVAQLRRFNAAR